MLWALLVSLATSVSASFCGANGVPFSIEVLPNGVPLLGCAQPTCIAQPADDQDDSHFNLDSNGQPDGFFRPGDRDRHAFAQTNKYRAECPGEFGQLACTKKNQWVGGIDYTDHPRQPLVLQCCTFEGLRYSQDVGVTTIGIGEAVTGGEVIRDNRQISFDVIANVRKVVDPDDPRLISYEVTVRRMTCLPDPPEIEAPVDDTVFDEVLRVLEKANNGTHSLGHEGHEHMEIEKQRTGPKRRKGHKQSGKKKVLLLGTNPEPFVGSFGAPIFTPNGQTPYQRHVDPPKRVHPTTVAPPPTTASTQPPTQPPIQTPTQLPTMALFTFPTLAPLPVIQPAQLFPLAAPSAPRPLPHAFGVSQASLSPLPPPTHFTLPPVFQTSNYNPFLPYQPQQQSPAVSPYGVGAGGQFDQTQTFGLQPSPPAPQLQQPALLQPAQNAFIHPTHPHLFQHNLFGLPQQQPLAFGLPQQPAIPLQPIKPPQPQPPAGQQAAPQSRQLGNLFAPPTFGTLESALSNFRNQG